jgi:hypothetical protein
MDVTIPGNGASVRPAQQLVRVEVRFDDPGYADTLYEHLERGDILLLYSEDTPYLPAPEDQAFLRAQPWQTGSSSHKNIAYKPHLKVTTGLAENTDPADSERLHRVLSSYSEGALSFLGRLVPRYGSAWTVDYATLRGMEEAGRDLPTKRRNDLMHVDAFPTRPTHGGRILRAFTNINQTRPRVWACAEPFADLAARYAGEAGLDRVSGPGLAARRAVAAMARLVGVKAPDRSAYDEFMLNFHDFLKQNEGFQQTDWENVHEFPPGSTWVSFTDGVAHKVISGQYAIEQTCIVPLSAMLHPEWAPVRILETFAGRPLIG